MYLFTLNDLFMQQLKVKVIWRINLKNPTKNSEEIVTYILAFGATKFGKVSKPKFGPNFILRRNLGQVWPKLYHFYAGVFEFTKWESKFGLTSKHNLKVVSRLLHQFDLGFECWPQKHEGNFQYIFV